MLARAARVTIAFGVIAGATFHAVATVILRLPVEFVASNLTPTDQRYFLLTVMFGAAFAAVISAATLLSPDAARALPALEWLVRLWCPLIVAPLGVALLQPGFAPEVETALLLAVFVIALERLLRISLGAWEERLPPLRPTVPGRLAAKVVRFFSNPRAVFITLLVLVIAQTIFLGTWAVWAHQRFSTYGYDLGCYDGVFACTLHGRWLASPPMGLSADWSDLTSNHADLAVFYLLPIYALFPNAITLLVIQAIVASAAAIPLYLFARRHVSVPIAFGLAVAWLLYAPMQSAQFYDYHPQYLGAAFVVCAIAAVEHRRWVLYWVFFTLAILTREDVSIGLTALGLYLALSNHRLRTGLATVAVAAVYFVSLRFFVMTNTAFAGMYKNLYAPGLPTGFGSILVTLVSNPGYAAKTLVTWEKARYVAQIFGPLAFLPMRRPLLWLLMIPGFFVTLISTEYLPTIQISFQYVANWAAYMFPAAAIVLGHYATQLGGRARQRAAIFAVLGASIVATVQWGAYTPRWSIRGGFGMVPLQRPTEADHQRERDLRGLLARVPEKAHICVSDRLQPHTTAIVLENWPLSWGVAACDYLLWSDLPADRGQELGPGALGSGVFELVEQRGGLTLARKKPGG